MINFFTELKLFVERYNCENTDGLFFEYRGSKITYDVAEEIYMAYFPLCDEVQYCREDLEEKADFIRLLRDENSRLRGNAYDV
jgi:hypothetical protein